LDYYEPEFQLVEDDGTSHMNVVDEHGMAVSITSTINTGLGAKVIGTRTGIFFNNEMDDFSTPGFSLFLLKKKLRFHLVVKISI
jgi:gamma-glutamyltranspeptidase/glutathione hydrolase/leukotriene-C4 hydrolase